MTLNRDNVQAYFGGINDILNELEEAKSDLEVCFRKVNFSLFGFLGK